MIYVSFANKNTASLTRVKRSPSATSVSLINADLIKPCAN